MNAFAPWKILHLDLAATPPPLEGQPVGGGVYLVLWLADVPVGHLAVEAAQLPMTAAELRGRAVRASAAAIGDRLFSRGFAGAPRDVWVKPGSQAPPPLEEILACDRPATRFRELWRAREAGRGVSSRSSVTVVICTRDRPDDLRRCLESLRRSRLSPDEMIVVDNAPRNGATRSVVEEFPEVRYVPESRPGLSVARNTGVRVANGEIVAFTDDDVQVHPEWTARLADGFADEAVLALTGLVLPARLDTEPQWLFETAFGGFSQGYHRLVFDRQFFAKTRRAGVPVWRMGAGANMAFRRSAFREVGLFDERLGAGAAGCSEDSEFWYRLLARGGICVYEPAGVVFHHHRLDMAGLSRQMNHYMRGHVATLLFQAARHRHPGNLYRLGVTLPWYYAKKGGYGLLRGFNGRHSTIPAEIAGCFSGLKYYVQHRHQPAYVEPAVQESQ